jgi:hypothetical protein
LDRVFRLTAAMLCGDASELPTGAALIRASFAAAALSKDSSS